ncbi:MAG: 7-cyano-7-deazaguanine synthase QueC [Spirochaetes bacterium]|nr:7-cyano-7-deazaguanine synthase QueC [Spirochaetota bacterium]
MKGKKCVILLSGGLDSATVAAVARNSGFDISAITFSYGQRHDIEIGSSRRIAEFFNITDHRIIQIPSDIFRSALTDRSINVPKNRESIDGTIPPTYVPARNILFLSYALAYAESISASDIFIGANCMDYSGYPDCRPEFFDAFQKMADAGTKAGIDGKPIRITAPLLKMKKSEIIKAGTALGVDYSMTISCYDPDRDGRSCGRCDSCRLRIRGFSEAGVSDPTVYQIKS